MTFIRGHFIKGFGVSKSFVFNSSQIIDETACGFFYFRRGDGKSHCFSALPASRERKEGDSVERTGNRGFRSNEMSNFADLQETSGESWEN